MQTRHRVLIYTSFILFTFYFVYDLPSALNAVTPARLSVLYSIYAFPNMMLPLLFGMQMHVRTGFLAILLCVFVLIGQMIFCSGIYLQRYFFMVLGRFLYGIGGESFAVIQNKLITENFKHKQLAFAMGLSSSIARMGTVFNYMVTPMIAAYIGKTQATLFGVFLVSVAMYFCVLVVNLREQINNTKLKEMKQIVKTTFPLLEPLHPTNDMAQIINELNKQTSLEQENNVTNAEIGKVTNSTKKTSETYEPNNTVSDPDGTNNKKTGIDFKNTSALNLAKSDSTSDENTKCVLNNIEVEDAWATKKGINNNVLNYLNNVPAHGSHDCEDEHEQANTNHGYIQEGVITKQEHCQEELHDKNIHRQEKIDCCSENFTAETNTEEENIQGEQTGKIHKRIPDSKSITNTDKSLHSRVKRHLETTNPTRLVSTKDILYYEPRTPVSSYKPGFSILVATVFMFSCVWAPYSSIAPLLLQEKYKVTQVQSGRFMAFQEGMTLIFVSITGLIADLFGHKLHFVIAGTLLQIISFGLLFFNIGPWQSTILFAFSSPLISCFWPCITDLVEGESLGIGFAIFTCVLNVAYTFGPLMAATILRLDGSFDALVVYFFVVSVFAIMFLFWLLKVDNDHNLNLNGKAKPLTA